MIKNKKNFSILKSMKKNNTYLADYEFDLGDVIKSLWREKILILSISIICGLAGYFYASFQPQEFKSEIKFKKPPVQLFEPYFDKLYTPPNDKIYSTNIVEEFIAVFNSNFLSLDNLQTFTKESREFDNFKGYLQSRNISAKKYFGDNISEVKEKNSTISNKYFLVFSKELDGDIFLNNYAEFIKKKTVFEIKKILQTSIENKIANLEFALEKAKLVNLEDPIFKTLSHQMTNEPQDLLYKGSKILSHEIIYFNRLLIKLENEQFDFNIILDKPLITPVKKASNLKYFALGIVLALFLSIVIIFFKDNLRNN